MAGLLLFSEKESEGQSCDAAPEGRSASKEAESPRSSER